MNPGKRRKLKKIEFLKQRIEENVKKLEESLNLELEKIVTEEIEAVEEAPVIVEQETKTSKKKKVV